MTALPDPTISIVTPSLDQGAFLDEGLLAAARSGRVASRLWQPHRAGR